MKRTSCLVLLAALTLSGCQNADLLRPVGEEEPRETGERAFTRLDGDEPAPLTSEVAYERLDRIREAPIAERLELIDAFLADYPAARGISVLHELRGGALAAEQNLAEAADAYEQALALTRTDITGLPLETELPSQLALARLSAGQIEPAVTWLLRTSIADRSERIVQGLRWAWSNHYRDSGQFEDWVHAGRAGVAPVPPPFELPGLQEPMVAVGPGEELTLVNFWSPT